MLGWVGALALFCFSELIAYLTITSFSALVTNGKMRGGGAYYMISRSLGPAFGGSSGLLFWLTYCINVTFNTTAFTGVVFQTWFPSRIHDDWVQVGFSTATLFLLFLVAFKGAGAFAKVNYFIFAGLVVALIVAIGSVWLSGSSHVVAANLSSLAFTPEAGSCDADGSCVDLVNVTASYRPWAWSAECPPTPAGAAPEWCHLGGASGGNGRYGLGETLAYSPVGSGQCDPGLHSTRGTLCDLPHVFSFVFPAVVGMMEGANLSGDLADPGRSIPLGTIGAVSTAFLCYVLLIFGQAGTLDRGALQFDLNVMQHACVNQVSRDPTSRPHPAHIPPHIFSPQHACVNQYFVVLGIATACLSTALGSMFGSARIMQALARDQIFPPLRIFSKGSAHGDEPRRALVLTYLLAQCGLLVGGIDAVAPILTNFFLVTYTLTNAAAALLELSGVPNFRPHWRVYHWGLSLAGAALTLGAMFFLNYVFALITIAIVVLLFVYIYCAFDASRWPDISQALAFAAARRLLLALRRAPDDAKYWRPSVLLLLPADASPPIATCRRSPSPPPSPAAPSSSPDASSLPPASPPAAAPTPTAPPPPRPPRPRRPPPPTRCSSRARASRRASQRRRRRRVATASRHSEPLNFRASHPRSATALSSSPSARASAPSAPTPSPSRCSPPPPTPATAPARPQRRAARTTSRRRTPPSTRQSSPTAPPSAKTL